MATKTTKGIYVKTEIPDMIRHRFRHDRASYPNEISKQKSAIAIANVPCSTCGSSNGTAFSVSDPPICRVRGMGKNEAIHQSGKRMKPMKKHHACADDAGSSSVLR